jgi:hypothetical protein
MRNAVKVEDVILDYEESSGSNGHYPNFSLYPLI